MTWDEDKQEFICPECESHNVSVKSGMMCDLYTCRDCGYESMDLKIKVET